MGVMPWVLRKFGGHLQPGDVVVSNDPYGGVSHFPDIVLVMPIFWRDSLVGFSAIVEHHTDIGGRFPGGMGIACAEVYEEGVRIPGVKLFSQGKVNQELLDLIAANVRAPEDVLGDLEAQTAACRRGGRGVQDLLDKYGLEKFEACNTQLRQYSERAIRSCLAAIPDGEYVCEDLFEDEGLGGLGVKLKLTVKVRSDSVVVDFAGTARRCAAPSTSPSISPVPVCTWRFVRSLTPTHRLIPALWPRSRLLHQKAVWSTRNSRPRWARAG